MSEKLRADMFGVSQELPRIIEIDLYKIQRNPNQPRKFFDEQSIADLASSIDSKGLLQPILVQKIDENDTYIIVAGERRFRAYEKLGLGMIAAIITNGDADEIALIENMQRENLRPLEEAEGLMRLISLHNYTHDDAAQVIGKARNTVTELLSLINLPETIKSECRTSDIATKSFLVELARLPADVQLQTWEELKLGKATVRSIRSVKAGKGTEASESGSPYAKATRALYACIATLQKASGTPTPDEREQITEAVEKLQEELKKMGTTKTSE